MLQQFELSTFVGGFTAEEAEEKGTVTLESRNGLVLSLALSEQSSAVKKLVMTMLDRIHTTDTRHQFGRNLMLEEAFANQMIHGNGGNPELKSSVVLTVQQQLDGTSSSISCILRLDDHSEPFLMENVPDPSEEENLDHDTGRGLKLMRELGKATITQVSRDGKGKAMLYSWTEPTVVAGS